MEDNNHPSLPSNYVTLAQLQERWLKQKEKEKQLQEKHQQQQLQKQQQQQIPKLPQHDPREYHGRRPPKTQQQTWRVIPTHPTRFGHADVKRPPAESGPKNPKISESNRVAVEVSREKNESVEAKADIGDGNDDQDGKKESKKKRKTGKRKPRADEEKKKLAGDATRSTVVGKKEVANSDVQRVDDKRETKIELNGSKRNDLMMEVEQKLGTLSMNFEDDKQNSRVRTYNSFRGSQRNSGGRNYRIVPYGDRNSKSGPHVGRTRTQEVQRRRVDQQIWVKKSEDSNGNVDQNELSSK